ncbi:MAG: zinc/iron-chelating domain-containing protein [Desulfovibrio sp.]|jgi:Fe-S-cluster containining protein|nr:zinc/iron-chelating domain-containing protein [Desulfovibrio sp.]
MPGYSGVTPDDAEPSCALCAAAGKTCCRADPAQAHLIFPLSPAERRRLAANTADGGETPWAARPNTPDFISAVHSLFPRDKKRIEELFPADGEHWSLRLRPDGACVFLDSDGCRLPRGARPGYCLLFPVWIVGGTLTLFASQECLIARKAGSPARCAGLMGTDRAGLSLTYARLRREWGLEHFTNEMSELLCKDLPANPCRETGAGGLCPP